MPDLFVINSEGDVVQGLKCTDCELSRNCQLKSNCMEPSGPSTPTFLIVGHSCGVEDDKIGLPFTGRNGRMFREMLSQAGLPESICRFSNLLRCANYEVEPKDTHWKKCKHHFLKDLKEHRPKAIITLGAKALSWVTGQTGVRQFRRCGIPCLYDESIYVYPLQQPLAITHADTQEEADQLRAEMISDLVWLKHKADQDTLHEPDDTKLDYKLAATIEDVRSFLSEFEGVEEVCYDFETADEDLGPALKPRPGCNIAMVALSKGAGHARCIPYRARGITTIWWWTDEEQAIVHELLTEFFKKHKFFGSNAAKFDRGWCKFQFGVVPRTDYDVQYAQYLTDENLARDLESMAIQWAKMPPWKPPNLKILMKDTMGLAKYASRDVDATWRVKQLIPYDKRQRWLMENLLIPLSYEFLELEARGITISKENLALYGKYLDELIQKHEKEVRALQVVKDFEISDNCTFNHESPAHIARIMRDFLALPQVKETKKSGGYSTDISVLEEYMDDEFVGHIYYLRKLTKLKSSYYEVIRKCLELGPKISTDIRIDGTNTGRCTSKNPNLFVLPRADTVKETGIEDVAISKAIFVPEFPDWWLLQGDLSQVELRGLAMLSGDPGLIQIYKDGIDLHRATASKVFGVPMEEVTDGQRSQAKATNFGIIYGMSEVGLAQSFIESLSKKVREKEHRKLTQEEKDTAANAARSFILAHKNAFPKAWLWMERQERLIRQYGYQETLTGRRRHYQRAGHREIRQGLNFPIQSLFSGDLTYFVLLWVNKLIREMGLEAHFLLTVYDSLVYQVSDKDRWTLAGLITSVVEEALPAAFSWLTLPIKVDVEMGKDLGHMLKADLQKRVLNAKK